MNIKKYQLVSADNKLQEPHEVRENLKKLLIVMEKNADKSPIALKTYNLLCGVEALLCRYETVSRETVMAINVIDDEKEKDIYLHRLHTTAMQQSVYVPKMIGEG